MGNISIFSQNLHTYNPFKLYSDFKSLKSRVSHVEGNLNGEGLLKGGLIIVHPTKGIVYTYHEQMGFELPFADISAAIDSLDN